ncbi:uncharacterized protein LOC115886542 isoform X2 [Sitophilus oryzae]|uniref:Uncharacterized protein LOC115886542 isoform X2 n=1 Tax=Sitophilus oryzae TaxID=7048 RepID=A0A6J2YE03_SITOR|nr:uncharacterized protein LOC115886542 isoform X2 [Sitophilus oryzae]
MYSGGWVVDQNEEAVVQSQKAKTDRNHSFSKKLWYELYSSKPSSSGCQGIGNSSVVFKCLGSPRRYRGESHHISVVFPEPSASGSQARFIDIDVDENSENQEYSSWNVLPDLLLEEIFSYLSIRERYYASLVCRSWYRAFHLPYVWKQFILEDSTLTRSKFNYYLGWQYVLDHLRTSLCLSSIGKHIKTLIIKPMFSFTNLYDFVNILSWYTEQQEQKDNIVLGIGGNVRHLKFTFPCNMTTEEDDERIRLFGTGGKLLAALKRLMGNLKKMESLELVDLMLEPNEAQFLLDEVCQMCQMSMKKLRLVNTTKVPYQILHVGVFLNLFELHISPQNIGNDLAEMLGFTHLKHLHLVQNRYTIDEGFIKPVCQRIWKKVRTTNPRLNVHLEVESKKYRSVVWQEGAPVRSIVYNSPLIGVKADILLNTIDVFREDLRIYGHLNVPEFEVSKLFDSRNDESYFMLVRTCTYLSTLIITERISTSTVLLLAYTGRNLKWFHVRGTDVIEQCDWPKGVEWTDDFYAWLELNSGNFCLTTSFST